MHYKILIVLALILLPSTIIFAQEAKEISMEDRAFLARLNQKWTLVEVHVRGIQDTRALIREGSELKIAVDEMQIVAGDQIDPPIFSYVEIDASNGLVKAERIVDGSKMKRLMLQIKDDKISLAFSTADITKFPSSAVPSEDNVVWVFDKRE